jgi:hypothetical protein
MNEKLKELKNRAFEMTEWGELYYDVILERFGELIIEECIGQGDTLANHYINTHSEQEQVILLASIADYSNEIKKHFGVEE